jgi:hypothetical protein
MFLHDAIQTVPYEIVMDSSNPSRKILRLIVRDDDEDSDNKQNRIRGSPPSVAETNLFVRLSPETARDLQQLAMNNQHSTDHSSVSSGWNIGFHALEGSDPVPFLPLKIWSERGEIHNNRNSDAQTNSNCLLIYASYNGGTIHRQESSTGKLWFLIDFLCMYVF